MSYTFDLEAAGNPGEIAQIRSITDDVTSASSPVAGKDYVLTDERIAGLLKDARDESDATALPVELRLRAAASCLGILAVNQGYVLKKKKTMAEETDGPAVSASIRADAKALLLRADALQTKRRVEVTQAAGGYRKPRSGSIDAVSTF